MALVIAYYRVSTAKQGASGLGLEGQEVAVKNYVKQQGDEIKASFVEVESGKKSDRPELARALAMAKRCGARLVVAKLDRLARNVEFLARLMNSGVEFTACDNPTANRLTIHILAAVAEAEARAISERTKAALMAAKARGQLLGSHRPGHWEGHEEARKKGLAKGRARSIETRIRAAREAVADLVPMISSLRDQGKSFQQIADELNSNGHSTSRGKQWSPMQVKRIIDRK